MLVVSADRIGHLIESCALFFVKPQSPLLHDSHDVKDLDLADPIEYLPRATPLTTRQRPRRVRLTPKLQASERLW
jgi:hypothetical protein